MCVAFMLQRLTTVPARTVVIFAHCDLLLALTKYLGLKDEDDEDPEGWGFRNAQVRVAVFKSTGAQEVYCFTNNANTHVNTHANTHVSTHVNANVNTHVSTHVNTHSTCVKGAQELRVHHEHR